MCTALWSHLLCMNFFLNFFLLICVKLPYTTPSNYKNVNVLYSKYLVILIYYDQLNIVNHYNTTPYCVLCLMILASQSTSRSSTCRQPIIKCMYSATGTYHICKKVECDHKKYHKKYCTPTIHFVWLQHHIRMAAR